LNRVVMLSGVEQAKRRSTKSKHPYTLHRCRYYNHPTKNSDPAEDAPPIVWPPPPADLVLRDNEIHLYCAAPAHFHADLPRLATLLSPSERARAERFRFPHHRESYIIRHGILRTLLGRYLGIKPETVEFRYGEFKKPEVANTKDTIHFNDSHSGGLVLYGFTRACPIGVDIEHLRPVEHFEQIARHYFSPREFQLLNTLPEADRIRGFFSLWTRKEAFLKATGEGIGQNLAKIEVTPDEKPEILATHFGEPGEWQMESLAPAKDYLTALAVKHQGLTWRTLKLVSQGA
jgi:4'-phosphopantetheinyl transferase